jgi:hypothetical protein
MKLIKESFGKIKLKKICIIRLGNIVEGLIEIITLGWGHEIAGWIAWKYFKTHDCGCERRRVWLNKIVGCNDDINLF